MQIVFASLTVFFACCLSTLPAAPQTAPTGEHPNLVFILVDDMPWFGTSVAMDPKIPGSAMKFLQMPNVEKLSRDGMTFSNARAAAGMCAPARCSIQTGMMTAHHLFSGNGGFGSKTDGNVKYINRPKDPAPLIEPEPQGNIRFPSIGDVLHGAGYATAHFGKWHIYGGGPAQHGYDESDGETNNQSGKDPQTGKRVDETVEDPKEMFGITQRGMDFMERTVKAGKPFYLQLSHYATHAAYQTRLETLKKYESNPLFSRIDGLRERHEAILVAAMCEDLDTAIGQVLAKIKALGIEKNTYVVFTSDNGYQRWNEGNALLRGNKWWLWECGIRVPLVVRGPGIEAGTHTSANVVGYDFLPTFADLAGANAKVPKEVDGVSFAPVLLGKKLAAGYLNRPLFFHYPHYRVSPPCSAIVEGETKLLHFYEWPDENYVFDLTKDLGEKNNIAKANPTRTAQMYQAMMDKFKAVGAYFPKPNPKADPNAKRYNPNDPSEVTPGG